jgi:hypothetical protein
MRFRSAQFEGCNGGGIDRNDYRNFFRVRELANGIGPERETVVTATAKKASQEISPNATSDFPRLPWPIPLEGVSIEVARWWHGPTEKRNAWHVVYRIRICRDTEEERAMFSQKPIYRLRADSFEEDFVTKGIRLHSYGHDEKCVEVSSSRNSRKALAVLVAAWDEIVASVRAIAAKQERRYDSAVAGREW